MTQRELTMTLGSDSDAPLRDERWHLVAAELGAQGERVTLAASEAERTALAERLALLAIESFQLEALVRPLGRDRVKVKGRLTAQYQQACGVTLEPIEAMADEAIEAEFWPAEEIEALGPDHDPLEDDAPEPIEAGLIDLGRLAYEVLAVTIDPYLRKDDAELERSRSGDDAVPDGPFADLARLRGRAEDGGAN